MSIKKATELVIEYLEASAVDMNIKIESLDKSGDKVSEAEIIKRAIESENRKLIKVKEAYEEGIDTIEEYRENKARINKKLAELNDRLEKAMPEISTDTEAFREKITSVLDVLKNDSISEKMKNETLRSIVSKIVLFKPENRLEIHFYQ